MNSHWKAGLIGLAAGAVAVGASLHEYRHNRLVRQVHENTQHLMEDPQARPDAWTKTQDDQRNAELRAWIQEEIAKACKQRHDSESESQ